jgi:excisionase family DNA binding protein
MKKEVLTLSEVAEYTGLSRSHIYKLCSTNAIPYYKPFGKVNYFDRLEIISWLKQNRGDKVEKKTDIKDTPTNITL